MSDTEITVGGLKGSVGILARQELLAALCICAGQTNKEIARVAGVSPTTVKKSIERVFYKLQVSKRAHLAAEAMRRGIIVPACVAFLGLLVGLQHQPTTTVRSPAAPRQAVVRIAARQEASAWVA